MLAARCLRTSLQVASKPRLFAAPLSTATPHDFIREHTPSPFSAGGISAGADALPPTVTDNAFPLSPPTANPFRSKAATIAQTEKPVYHLHWKSTKHNTVATLTNDVGNILAWESGGRCGFKHARRGEYEAGYQCAVRIFKRIEEKLVDRSFHLELLYKGFGQGRQALDSVLLTSEGETVRPIITRLTDRTPLKIGGTRARKARRL
ncbi:translational machinery component [Athelia psychrophila]|uniref:Translational machinery component n=1 Tax=Athelia psychrophila TaxID=1759441 RepID=A0A166N395_9AGAM|nr:translational machinery component [Fibularhizoctonia sp. CBS 109695]